MSETPHIMKCGHHKLMLLFSAETGQPLYCSVCDELSSKQDLVTDAQTQLAAEQEKVRVLREALKSIEPRLDRYGGHTGLSIRLDVRLALASTEDQPAQQEG